MYDQETHSLWNQFTVRPVVGPLTGSGIELAVRPAAITTWKHWLAHHPDTKVLSLDTGFDRRPYASYFSSADLMFPVLVEDTRLKPKDYVFALRSGVNEKAWPLSEFAGGQVINDRIGTLDIVLIGDAASRTVRAYDARGRDFTATFGDFTATFGDADTVESEGHSWMIEEESLTSVDAQTLPRLPGHIAYWFAWSGYKSDAPPFER
jgi:hypothetical protein